MPPSYSDEEAYDNYGSDSNSSTRQGNDDNEHADDSDCHAKENGRGDVSSGEAADGSASCAGPGTDWDAHDDPAGMRRDADVKRHGVIGDAGVGLEDHDAEGGSSIAPGSPPR